MTERRRLFFVIDVDDPEDDLFNLSNAATWMESCLRTSGESKPDVTCYRRLKDMVADAKDGAGAFQDKERIFRI